jgi:hypothetical protein
MFPKETYLFNSVGTYMFSIVLVYFKKDRNADSYYKNIITDALR